MVVKFAHTRTLTEFIRYPHLMEIRQVTQDLTLESMQASYSQILICCTTLFYLILSSGGIFLLN